MNKHVSKHINEFKQKLEDALVGAVNDFEEWKDAEQNKLDAMPESLQNGPTGTKMQEWIDALDAAQTAVAELEEALDAFPGD